MSSVDRIGSVCRVCARFLDSPGQGPDWQQEVMSFLRDMFLKRHPFPVKRVIVIPTTTVWLDKTMHNCAMCGTDYEYLFSVEVVS